jgi:predicted  nucleic acid-binding Zn-ribbon protein
MSRVSTLLYLQSLDQELDEKINRVREIDGRLGSDPTTAAARSARDAEQTKLSALRAALRERELEAKGADAHIKELEQRLYGGRVMNPKELEGIEKEVQMLKRQRSGLDDQLLELMEAVDQSQKRLNSSADTATQAGNTRAGDVERLSQEKEKLSARLTELAAEQEEVRTRLDLDTLRVYDNLRRKGGRAVAPLHRDACSICGVAVPTGHVQRVRAGNELVFCSGCGRILAG